MKINRVELTNIKPFAERAFDFADGVNVLSGPNGSGKSTVFEAIGYALFGVKASDFIGSADRFVRKGFKTGTVRVSFTAVDGVDYVVERKVGAVSSWHLFQVTPDGLRAVETKGNDETEAALTRLLGLSDSRSLGVQFTTIIGPPQARFDGAFGATGKPRMDEFDRILGISAWTEANSMALGVDNEAKGRIRIGEERSASLSDRTAKFDDVVTAFKATTIARDALTAELAASDKGLTEVAALIVTLEAAEALASERRSAAEAAGTAFALATERAAFARQKLDASVEAVAICKVTRDEFDAHIAATNALSVLDEERKERDGLSRRKNVLDADIAKTEVEATAAIANATTELERLETDRAMENQTLAVAESDLELIVAGLEKTGGMDLAAARWVSALAGLPSPAAAVSVAHRAIANLVDAYTEVSSLRSEVAGRDEVASRAARSESSVERATAAVVAVASIDAQLERFRHDVASLSSGHCPILDESCLNLAGSVDTGNESGTMPAPLARRIDAAEAALAQAVEAKRTTERDAAEHSKALQQLAVLDAAAIRLEKVEADFQRRCESATAALACAVASQRDSAARSWLDEAPTDLDPGTVADAVASLEAIGVPPVPRLSLGSAQGAGAITEVHTLADAVAALNDTEHELAAAWIAIGDAASSARARVSHELSILEERHRSITTTIASTKERLLAASDRTVTYRESRADAERRLAGLEAQRKQAGEIAAALAAFVDLDERIESAKARLTASRDGHNRFQQNEPLATRHDEMEALLAAAADARAAAESALNEAHAAAATAAAAFDPSALAAAREHEKQLAAARSGQHARLAAAVVEHARLGAERDELARMRDEKRAIDRELVLLRKTHAAIASMRSGVMAKVPPRLASRYRDDVSIRADRIYRRIAGSDEELRWGDDYQIQLVDMATNAKGDLVERVLNDNQLSGGQKMTAVIALRLALLQMTRSSVGFFDEPTSNLDAERRARLADAFRDLGEGRDENGGGRWYGQLFLISHDAAFTEITDHTTWLDAIDSTPMLSPDQPG